MIRFREILSLFEEKLNTFEALLSQHEGDDDILHFMMLQAAESKKSLLGMKEDASREHPQIEHNYRCLVYSLDAWNSLIQGKTDEAIMHLKTCAKENNLNAMMSLAIIYSDGLYVEKDVSLSNHWYGQAAELGNAYALRNMGKSFYRGLGVKKNQEVALSYFLRAANKSDPEALFYLGEMFEHGYVVNKDIDRANEYYEFAEKAGHKRAAIKRIPSDDEILPPPFHLSEKAEREQASQDKKEDNVVIDLQLEEPLDGFQVKAPQLAARGYINHGHPQQQYAPQPASMHEDVFEFPFLKILFAAVFVVIGISFVSGALLKRYKVETLKTTETSERVSKRRLAEKRSQTFKGIKSYCRNQLKEKKSKGANNLRMPVICHFGSARNMDDLALSFSLLRQKWYGKAGAKGKPLRNIGSFTTIRAWCSTPEDERAFFGQTKAEEAFVCGFQKLRKPKEIRRHFSNYRIAMLKIRNYKK
ncbi:MAG: sel1 repeat family protein [Oligoflexales bacterium]|nr:sel1 repeat family protein [Oligoflexales bacterium]